MPGLAELISKWMSKKKAERANAGAHSGANAAGHPGGYHGNDTGGHATQLADPPAPPADPAREATISQLKKGYNELVDTMGAVRRHMEQQSERSDRMLQLLEELPGVIKTIPETQKSQTAVLETIQKNIAQQNDVQDRLGTALGNLASATESQERTLHGVKETLSENHAAEQEMLADLSTTMTTSNRSNEANTAALNALVEQAKSADAKTLEMFENNRKSVYVITGVSWALCLVAVATALYVAYIITVVLPPAQAGNGPGAAGANASAGAAATQPAAQQAGPAGGMMGPSASAVEVGANAGADGGADAGAGNGVEIDAEPAAAAGAAGEVNTDDTGSSSESEETDESNGGDEALGVGAVGGAASSGATERPTGDPLHDDPLDIGVRAGMGAGSAVDEAASEEDGPLSSLDAMHTLLGVGLIANDAEREKPADEATTDEDAASENETPNGDGEDGPMPDAIDIAPI